MNTQLINNLKTKASEVRVSGFGDTEILDADKLVIVTVEEVIALLKKSNPDFNNFSERLVRRAWFANTSEYGNMGMNRAKWTCVALATASHRLCDGSYPTGALFIGEQSGVAQALKDCQVPQGWGYATGLNKGQYQLTSTGKVSPKLLKMDLYGRPVVF